MNVDKVKIEYLVQSKDKQLEKLIEILENAGFQNIIYKTNPEQKVSNKVLGHIYGIKKSS